MRLCESDARCFGVEDNNYGKDNKPESERYQRCSVFSNKERHTSVAKRAIHVKGILLNCIYLFGVFTIQKIFVIHFVTVVIQFQIQI